MEMEYKLMLTMNANGEEFYMLQPAPRVYAKVPAEESEDAKELRVSLKQFKSDALTMPTDLKFVTIKI